MKLSIRIIMAFIDIIRPVIGPKTCCIYQITCRQYAYKQLISKPLYKAIFLIMWRVFSCNPITRMLFLRNFMR